MLLAGIGSVGLIGSVRLLIWRIDTQSRRFTAGMLIVSAGTILFLPEVGEQTVDPATRFAGANASNLITHLATVLACYLLVTGPHPARWTITQRRYWCAFCSTAGTVMLASYLLGDRIDTPADQFALWDPWSVAGYWALAVTIVVSFALLAGISLANLSGVDLRVAMCLTLLMSVISVAVGATIAIHLATDPAWLRDHYRCLITHAASPALLTLAASGIPGLVRAWKHRDDPM